MLFPFACQFEGEAKYAIDAAPRKDRLLHRHFVLCSFIKAAANIGVLAFVIFANDGEIDLARLPIFQRRFDSCEKPHGTKIHVLAECTADWNKKPPKRYVVRNAGMTYGAEENGVEWA